MKALVAVHNDVIDYPFIKGYPKQEWYLQLCLDGAKSYGDKFYDTFVATTYGLEDII